MEYSARQISELIGGTVEGNPDVKVSGVAGIEEGRPGTLAFLGNARYEHYLAVTEASIVIVNENFQAPAGLATTLIRVKDAYLAFAKLLDVYDRLSIARKGIEQPSFISPSARLGEDVYVGAMAYISDKAVIGKNVKIFPQAYVGDGVTIGDHTVLYSGVKIYAGCVIGANCIFHSGVVIGADGFGFTPQKNNEYKKVSQIGNVIIEDNVEIGANSLVDRATMGSTIIRKGVKLDNLIQVGHNVEIGENTVIAAQTGIAGSTKIGKDCMIGGQVGIVGHITIADKVKIAAQSGISSSILHVGEVVQGSPAFGITDYKRSYVLFKKLPEMEKRIKELEQALIELKHFTS